MKKIQNWKKFNELKEETYRNAAKKADDLGDKVLSDRFRQHSNKSNLDSKFNFVSYNRAGIETRYVGKFLGTEPGMESDMFFDQDEEMVEIVCRFEMNTGGSETATFQPFWIYYNIEKDEVGVEGPFGIDDLGRFGNEEDFPGLHGVDEGSDPILFSSRADANKFIKLLKNNIELDAAYDKAEKSFMKVHDDLISKIQPRMLYKTQK